MLFKAIICDQHCAMRSRQFTVTQMELAGIKVFGPVIEVHLTRHKNYRHIICNL